MSLVRQFAGRGLAAAALTATLVAAPAFAEEGFKIKSSDGATTHLEVKPTGEVQVGKNLTLSHCCPK